MKKIKIIILFFIVIVSKQILSQTLIMNEVSNGASGNQEYVEFVVVNSAVTYTCSSSTPPCIDIRGWIFDDNSGYHGTSGVATGAVRFANNPIWACVPLGTIILIYNNADRNIAIPPDDLSMIDGNCTIIAPINSSLFESNTTTPGAIACSYPPVGWTLGGNWNNTLLANVGDCARIVNLSGCEVFSVCWGSDNLNNLIYFPATAAQRVYYFNNINPQLQANWTNGSASPSPGSQTPGAPNNALNAAYIAQFNNGCLPITSLSVAATSINAGCTCNGSATANASGSIAGYTYLWSDGQATATATGLCAGIYTVTATSLIGCVITTTVAITSTSSTSVTINSQTICAGSSTILTATPSAFGGTYLWLPSGQTTQTISVSPSSNSTYFVSYLLVGCTSSAVATVSVNPLPILTVNSSTICVGQSATLTSAGATTYSWNTGSTLNSLTVTPISTTNYTVTGTTAGCTNSVVATVSVNPLPILTVNSSTICAGQSATLTSAGATTYSWNTGSTVNPLTVNPISTTNYTVSGTAGGCTNSIVATVSVNPNLILIVNSPTICLGQTATLTVTGASTYTWSNGTFGSALLISPSSNSSYTINGMSSTCSGSTIATVSVNPLPVVTVNSSTICVGQSATLTSAGATTYTWNTGSTLNPLTVTPISTTNYTVTGTAGGCTNSVVATVSVNPLPILTVNSSTICVGQSATLTSAGATTYTWNTGSTLNPLTVTPISTTNYTVTGTIAGCINSVVATVLVNPLPILTVNSSTICVGQSATLTSAGATTYSWNTGSTVNPQTVTPISTTNYTVSGTTAGCTNSVVATVSVNPLPVVTVNSSTICVGQSATLTSVGATTYSWNTGSTLNPLTVTPISTTNYTVTGTTAGCSSTAISTVSVKPLPIVTVNASTICIGQSATLTAAGATTYTWNTGSTLNPLTVSLIATTNYTVTGTTAGCINIAVSTVSVNPLPIVTVNSPTICVGQSTTLTAAGATTYTWNTGSTLNPLTVMPIATTNYTVIGTTAGCTSTAVSTVLVKPLPIVTVNSSTICEGQSTTLTSAGATTYSWNTGSVSDPISVSPIVTTNYIVTGTSLFGCSASANGVVTIIPSPSVTALASQPIICLGGMSNLSAFGATNYTWSAGGATTSTIAVSPTVTSTYTVTGSNGSGLLICSKTQIVLVTVIPQTTIIVSISHPICVGESENIYAEGGDTYSWLPTMGVSNPSTFTTFVKPNTTTIYTVTASQGGLCPGTATLQIIVHPLPYVYAGVDATINMDESYVLHGIGNVPVGFLSPNSYPLICNYCSAVEVNPIETTCYTLKGESEFGCVAYDEVCINVTKDWNVYIPNAFSPNGDSDNEIFIPVGYGISDIKLYIFNRWGEVIFTSNNKIIGWDGTFHGNQCEQDVYVYKAEIKTMSGIKIFKTGHVTLLSNLK